MFSFDAVILAAGEGKRMKSEKSKVLHEVAGKPMIDWVHSAVNDAGINECIFVVGSRKEQVMQHLGSGVKYALQEQQLGTGHAVMQAYEFLKDKSGHVLILCADTPLITSETLKSAMQFHIDSNNCATVLTAEAANPKGYGRIVRDGSGNVIKIVEDKDADENQKKICEINSGMYCFSIPHLLEALSLVTNNNEQREYYLTDTLGILHSKGYKTGAFQVDEEEIYGVNDRIQLAEASAVLRKRINNKLMLEGVTIIDPCNTFIDAGVKIGRDTTVYPSAFIEGGTTIGTNCVIGPGCRIVDSFIGDGTRIDNSVILESKIGNNVQVGPFAYIRPESVIGDKAKIGDFVEIKKSSVGDKTKIPHLAYIGDAEIGSETNIACGVITVNYNGKVKNKTKVGNRCFIGCNVNLVAPVEVKDNAYVAAGSTITENVPEYSLAIAREKQTNKEGWVTKKDIWP